MGIRTRTVMFTAALVVTFAIVPSLAAAGGEIELKSENPLALIVGGKVTATAVNHNAAPIEVRFEASARNGTTKISLPVEPATLTLPAGESIALTVSAPASVAVSDTFIGQLTAFYDDTTTILNLTYGPATAPKPAVKKRTVLVYAKDPFNWFEPVVNGDRISTTTGTCTKAPAVAWAAGGPGDVKITPACSDSKISLGMSGLRSNQHYDFVGTLSSGGGDTEVTVRYSTIFVWPIAALVAGFALAIWAYRWVNGRRNFQLVRTRLTELVPLAASADKKFKRTAEGDGWAKYTIAIAVEREVMKRLAELDGIEATGGKAGLLTPQQIKDLTKLIASVQPSDAFVTEWPAAHDVLFIPASSLRHSDEWSDTWTTLPRLATWLDGVLSPGDPAPLRADDYDKLKEELGLLESALELGHAYAFYVKKLADSEDQLDPQRADLGRAQAARRDLAERLENRGKALSASGVVALAARVDKFRTLVNTLPEPAKAEVAGAAVTDADAAEARLEAVLANLRKTTHADVAAVRRLTIGRVDRAVIAVVGVVAIWSGLQALYFGKPWGNVVDYGAAIVWAFTATAVLTPLLATLNQPDATRFRLRADG